MADVNTAVWKLAVVTATSPDRPHRWNGPAMVDFDGKHIVIPSWDGVPHQIAEVWRMPKDAHSVVCSLWTHPEGAELR